MRRSPAVQLQSSKQITMVCMKLKNSKLMCLTDCKVTWALWKLPYIRISEWWMQLYYSCIKWKTKNHHGKALQYLNFWKSTGITTHTPKFLPLVESRLARPVIFLLLGRVYAARRCTQWIFLLVSARQQLYWIFLEFRNLKLFNCIEVWNFKKSLPGSKDY